MLRPLVTCCAAMALLLAASCSSDAEPETAPSASPKPSASKPATATSTPSPSTPSAPVLPAALPHTTDGAIAFMQFWFKAVEYAYATGDTEVIRVNSRSDCDACTSFTQVIQTQYDRDGSFRGARAVLTDIVAAPLEDILAPISLQVSEPPSEQLSKDGLVESRTNGSGPTNTTFYAAWIDGRWLAAEVVKDQA